MTEQNTKQTVNDLFILSDIVYAFMNIQRRSVIEGRRETDGEHTLHLQFLAVAYAARYHQELDIGRVALYAMVHDLVEVYAGDTPTLNASVDAMIAKETLEAKALLRLKRELGGKWNFIVELLDDYELLVDDESRFVRTFDKCDPAFTHYKNRGEVLRDLGINTIDKFQIANNKTKLRMAPYAEKFDDVVAVREELQERIAEVAYSDV
jgi:5'-deoxynucleotidase YfbR-like HD superfamily hydrolase